MNAEHQHKPGEHQEGRLWLFLQGQNNAQCQWLISQVLFPPLTSTLGGLCSALHSLLRNQVDMAI